MSKKVKIIIISAVAVIGIGGFVGVKIFNNRNNNKMMEQNMVELYTIPGKEKIFLTGKILPKQSEAFNIDGEFGELDKINVKDGQAVKKGDLLYSMKNTENINQISDLKTQVANKQNQLKNVADEESKGMLNSEITDLNSQITSLNKKTYKSVYAPFAGKVYLPESKVGTEGEIGALMVLETTDFYVKTETTEMEIVKLKKGQEIDIVVNATKGKAKGKIESIGERPIDGGEISSSYDGGGASYASFPIKIAVEEQKNLKNGFGVQAIAQFGSNENKLPLTSVLEENGKHFVFKIVNDVAKKSEIKVKERTDKHYVVIDGLSENDIIARDVSIPSIVDGQNIYGEGEATK